MAVAEGARRLPSRLPQSSPEMTARTLRVLGQRGDVELRDIVSLAAEVCQTEMAAVTVLDGSKVHVLEPHGIDPTVLDVDREVLRPGYDEPQSIVVTDASDHPQLKDWAYVDGRLASLRLVASAGIAAPDGTLAGRLCVVSTASHSLTRDQQRGLETLAGTITRLLDLRLRREAESMLLDTADVDADGALRILAQISHDMRIPLTALNAGLEMLQESEPPIVDPLRSRLLGTALGSAQRLERMVEGLLRLHRAGEDLQIATVDLFTLAQQVVSDSGPLLTRSGAAVDIGALPLVAGDADQLYSVLLNLMSNAAKFTRPGVPPFIEIRSSRVPDGWRISVVDNGRGIPPERRDDVFSLFRRLDSGVEGHGIGLATVHRIVAAHGGRVGIADGDGSGVEVWFELPAAPRAGTRAASAG